MKKSAKLSLNYHQILSNIYNLFVLLCEQSDEDSEPSEEEDRFVAQLYKFCDDRGTPINKAPSVGSKDLNLYKLFKIVQKLGGYNRVGLWRGVVFCLLFSWYLFCDRREHKLLLCQD